MTGRLDALRLSAPEVLEAFASDGTVSCAALEALVADFVSGQVCDAQMAAFAMAVRLRGLPSGRVAAMTSAMARSGSTLSWSQVGRPVADKHSTGGVGDKLSLVVAPLAAAAGLAVPMLSGRGLAHTGGTLDKLEAVPGVRVNLSPPEMVLQLGKVGCFVAAASPELDPADAKLYALRDVTATVASIPLIAASIVSKKAAAGVDNLVLDVKCGEAAFVKGLRDAVVLAELMVAVAAELGVRACAQVNQMDRLIGMCAGNACEVVEAFEVLTGSGPSDVREASLDLAGDMCALAGVEADLPALLDGGFAAEVFEKMLVSQGARLAGSSWPAGLARQPHVEVLRAARSGWFAPPPAMALGRAVWQAGAGRSAPGAAVDPLAGVELLVPPGAPVTAGDPLVALGGSDPGLVGRAVSVLSAVETVADVAPALPVGGPLARVCAPLPACPASGASEAVVR